VNRLARPRNPKRDEALEIFKEHDGNIQNREIAGILEIPEKTISNWKSRDKWVEKIGVEVCSTTKNKSSTTNENSASKNTRSKQREHVIDALIEAGTYSPALDLLIEIYLDAYTEYLLAKEEGVAEEKQRKEVARLLGQLGLDGKNKELIKKSGKLLAKGEDEEKKEPEQNPVENSKLLQFRKRRMRG
jgi:hypothetical protein